MSGEEAVGTRGAHKEVFVCVRVCVLWEGGYVKQTVGLGTREES